MRRLIFVAVVAAVTALAFGVLAEEGGKVEATDTVTITAEASGSVTLTPIPGAAIGDSTTNGAFTITRSGANTTLGNGIDEVTTWTLDFTGIAEGDTEACLTGQTFGGIAIAGCDAVRIVPPWLDSDGDGFGDAVEATLTTDQFAACPTDASHDANPADINNDTFVDITDIAAVAAWFGQEAPLALPRYDLKPDGFVDITDIVAVAALFGQSCTP